MRLKSLALDNIRSYQHLTVTFPKGIVLLSGDIGSGKSSILHAIEFALFGLLRGSLHGNGLLRHGAQSGSVTLTLQSDGSEYTITRTLKRRGQRVVQDTGSITTNGAVKNLTPSEIRSEVFTLLGYPESLVTKSKGLVYRYTVYTPQETMRQIVEESQDARLDTLRTLFDIDKYQTVKKNVQLYARHLTSKITVIKEQTRQIEQLRTELETCQRTDQQLRKEHTTLSSQHAARTKELQQARTQAVQNEEIKKKYDALNHEKTKLSSHFASQQQQQTHITKEITSITQQLKELTTQLHTDTAQEATSPQELSKERETINREIAHIQSQMTLCAEQRGAISGKQSALQSDMKRLEQLGTCPTCKQKVPLAHKAAIKQHYEQTLTNLSVQLENLNQTLAAQTTTHEQKKNALHHLTEQQQRQALRAAQHTRIDMLKERKQTLEVSRNQLTSHLNTLQTHMRDVEKQCRELEPVLTQCQAHAKHVEQLTGQERTLAIALSRCEERQTQNRVLIERIQKDLKEKEILKTQQHTAETHHAWLTKTIIPILDQTEIQVFASIHHQFNELFSRWFMMLVEDETFTVRLDETFSPVIQVQGYDSSYQQLSGGERTAVALAYRLALNSVVNTMIDTMNTRNILILDEPTDGFSATQLERMREVLHQLALDQIIIVSHETQIETYVDHVLRVRKEHGKSVVTN